MTKDEAIIAMRSGHRVTHRFFTDCEFIYMIDGYIYDEQDYKFKAHEFWSDRTDEVWDNDWELFRPQIRNDRPLMQCNREPDVCPSCGALEVPSNTPATTYGCGSYDYDGRPGTFHASEECYRRRQTQKQ